MSAEWKNGLFGCFNNLTMCALSYFVPCYIAGKNAEKVGDSCFVYGLLYLFLPCIFGAIIRGKVREKSGIEGGFLSDCCTHIFCGCCALAQEGQEVDALSIVRA